MTVLKADPTTAEHLLAALRATTRHDRQMARLTRRVSPLDGPGAVHVDRIVREVAAGVPGRPAWVRLLVAADLAAVLEPREVSA